MKLASSIAPFLVGLAAWPGCATYGVESADRVLAAAFGGTGIEEFIIDGMAVDRQITIQGGAARFEGEMLITGWFAPGEEHDVLGDVALDFRRSGNTLAAVPRFHHLGIERITPREAMFAVPAALDVSVDSASGQIAVADIDGDVAVAASGAVSVARVLGSVDIAAGPNAVRAESIGGPVTIEGGTVDVGDTGPVDIDASWNVTAAIARGGIISSGGDVEVRVTGTDFGALLIQAGGVYHSVTVQLPRGQGWTLTISGGSETDEDGERHGGTVTVAAGGLSFERDHVNETFQIGAGGPAITIKDAGDITVVETL